MAANVNIWDDGDFGGKLLHGVHAWILMNLSSPRSLCVQAIVCLLRDAFDAWGNITDETWRYKNLISGAKRRGQVMEWNCGEDVFLLDSVDTGVSSKAKIW